MNARFRPPIRRTSGRTGRALNAITRVFLALAVGAAVSGAAVPKASNAVGVAAAGSGYPWPLRPFDLPHPIRAVVGDPRTTFLHPVNGDPLAGSGKFSFHDGVDIDAPNGTRVYPAVSGTVRSAGEDSVVVNVADGRAFVYTHVVPAVAAGQRVIARATVLGRVDNWARELHFSEVSAAGHIVNPLLPGHLAPYRDTTRPVVAALLLRSRASGRTLQPFDVRGRIDLIGEADDRPEPVLRSGFATTPFALDRFAVVPAALTWSMRALDGRPVVRTTRVLDFRRGIPESESLWSVYARGTYQNRAPIVPRYHQKLPGRYLFRISRDFDTTALADGVYLITVAAVDVAGNVGSRSTRIEIRNHDALPADVDTHRG
jgi:murein DD-endopeptidase MepM/ murein hydrolase activator NlpD